MGQSESSSPKSSSSQSRQQLRSKASGTAATSSATTPAGAPQQSSPPLPQRSTKQQVSMLEQRRALRAEDKRLREEARQLILESRNKKNAKKEMSVTQAKTLEGNKDDAVRGNPNASKRSTKTGVGEDSPSPNGVKQKQKVSTSSKKALEIVGELPPDIAALMEPVDELEADLNADVLAAIAAAEAAAALLEDVDDDVDDDTSNDPTHTECRPPLQARKNAAAVSHDDDESISLHSSDYRDEDLMGQLAELESEVDAVRRQRVEELESAIAEGKQRALALMKGGDKPAALEELKRAKGLEKELQTLQDT